MEKQNLMQDAMNAFILPFAIFLILVCAGAALLLLVTGIETVRIKRRCHLVQRALDDNRYTLKYAKTLVKAASRLKSAKPIKNRRLSLVEDCKWIILSEYLNALAEQWNVMQERFSGNISSFRDYMIYFIDRLKTMIKNYGQEEKNPFPIDLLVTVLSIMEVNFLSDAHSVIYYEKELIIFNALFYRERDDIKTPEEWIEAIKATTPGLMSDDWYSDLIKDLHKIEQYTNQYDRANTLYFANIQSIYFCEPTEKEKNV